MRLEIRFTHSRETKGTHVYVEAEEAGQPPKVGTLYLKKYALPSPPPAELAVTIEAV